MARRREALINRRVARGMSQERLAEILGIDRSTVARWEAGTTEPQPWQRPRLAEALDITLDECDHLLTDDAEVARLEYAVRNPRSVDLGAVAVLREAVNDLAQRYDHTPSVSLLPEAGHYHNQVAFLREHATSDPVRRALYGLEAQSAALMGQLLWDASQRRDVTHSVDYFDRAASAARQAGDHGVEAYALLRKCFVALYGVKDAAAGASLAEQAGRLAHTAGQPALAGLALVHLAEAHAMCGDRVACDRALDSATDHLDAEAGAAGVAFTGVQFGRLSGSCHLSLGRPARAADILEGTSRGMQTGEKSQAIVLANLALAHLRQRNIDAAADALHRAIDIVESTRAGGGLTVAFSAGREMAPWRAEPIVRDIHDRLLGLMAA